MKTKNILTDVSIKILINKKQIQCSTIWLERIKNFWAEQKNLQPCFRESGWFRVVGVVGFLLSFVAIFLFYH